MKLQIHNRINYSRFGRFCSQTSETGFSSTDQVFSLFPSVPADTHTNTYSRQTEARSTHLEYRTPNATSHIHKLKHLLFQYA